MIEAMFPGFPIERGFYEGHAPLPDQKKWIGNPDSPHPKIWEKKCIFNDILTKSSVVTA